MGLITADEYRASLKDGRTIYYRGRKVDDITADPDLAIGVELGATDYEMGHDPEYQDTVIHTDESSGERYSRFYKIPRNSEDLLARSELIELSTLVAGTIPPLVKEIGTDALFALMRVLEGEPLERARAFYEYCRSEDRAIAVAQTDVKGDRSKGPGAQADPDHYVHVVEKNDKGIVVRGAKTHTSGSANSHELIVLPTRAMGPGDEDYAVSFAIPMNTPGLKLFVSPYAGGEQRFFDHPVSSGCRMLESLTVFDDVFVPWERVFICGETGVAGPAALTFVEYHRFTAVSYKLPLLDAYVGAAATIAEMNGVGKAGHIRDKLAHLIVYAETVRGLTHMAALRAKVGAHGIAYPDPMTTNMAKFVFAKGYHEHIALVQECAGGLLVTGPGQEDWDSPEIRPILEKYYAAAVPARERLKVMNMISDLTARDMAGYHAVLAVHAEGSVEAEKMQILRSYDSRKALARARRLARLDEA